MNLKVNKEKLIYNMIFFLTFVYNFVIFSRGVFKYNELVSGIFLIICLLISLLNFNINKKNYSFIFLIVFFILFIFIREKINFHVLFLYLLLEIDKSKDKKIYRINLYKYLGIVSLLIQAFIFRFDGRIVNSMIDPNYSGYVYFIFYIFLEKTKSKWKYIILILGLLTLSRNFILAYLVYNFVKIKRVKEIIFKIKLNSFFKIFLLGSFLIAIVGELYLFYFEKIYQGIYYVKSWKRVFNFIDYSNYYRFLANQKIFEFLKNIKSIFGVDINWYTENIFMNSPHNLYGVLIINYGIIFTILFFYLINKNLKINGKNLDIIMGLMVYYLILGYGILGFQLLITYYLLKLEE